MRRNFCPKCASPWIAGFYRSRFISIPRSSKLKLLLRREKAKRLNSLDKKLLRAYRNNQTLKITTCYQCKYELFTFTTKPAPTVAEDNNKEEDNNDKIKVLKKKRKQKDKTAGLKLQVTTNNKKEEFSTKENRLKLKSKSNQSKSKFLNLSENAIKAKAPPLKKKELLTCFAPTGDPKPKNNNKKFMKNIEGLRKALLQNVNPKSSKSCSESRRPSSLGTFLDSLL